MIHALRNELHLAASWATAMVVFATVDLSIPAILAINMWTSHDMALGLAPEEMVVLALTFAVTRSSLAAYAPMSWWGRCISCCSSCSCR